MKNILRIEEVLMFVLSMVLFEQLHFAWWWYLALFFTPDFSMLGYLVNTRIGAYCYNFFHHKGLAVAVGLLGFYLQNEVYMLSGIILFGHSSFDRILGYGLKFSDSFKYASGENIKSFSRTHGEVLFRIK